MSVYNIILISSVQSLSCVQLSATPWTDIATPWYDIEIISNVPTTMESIMQVKEAWSEIKKHVETQLIEICETYFNCGISIEYYWEIK